MKNAKPEAGNTHLNPKSKPGLCFLRLSRQVVNGDPKMYLSLYHLNHFRTQAKSAHFVLC